MTSKLKLLAASSLVSIAVLGANPAFAAGTAAGTDITNTVTVNFQVGGVDQTAETDSDTFKVDRKIDLTVAEANGAATSVSPGEQNAVTTFNVTNLSNQTLDFTLAAAQAGGDDFDVTGLTYFVDVNDNGTYEPLVDTATFIDELAADDSIAVFIIGDIDIAENTGAISNVVLTATAREGGTAASLGAAVTQTAGADDAAVVDTVFADGVGETDANRDASFSALDSYEVEAAAITVYKMSRVVSDPFNGTTNPKAIPGAVVEYCITVNNAAGSATATSVAISDSLPADVTYDSGFGILVGGSITGSLGTHTCNADGVAGGSFADPVVSATVGNVAADESKTVVFQVTVD